MQIFRPHPRWTESETQMHVGPAVCALTGLQMVRMGARD